MAKYKLQELPDLNNTGKRKVYPKMVVNRTLSRKEFIERMQGYHRGISASTTEAVLMDVEEILVEMLSMGYNVNLEGLGTFSLSLGFEDDKPTEMQGDDDKMTYRKVGVRDVNFKASPDFIKSVKQAADHDLERDMGGYINNLSRTAASLELKEIAHDETVPIRSVGQHSHKVWVRRKK